MAIYEVRLLIEKSGNKQYKNEYRIVAESDRSARFQAKMKYESMGYKVMEMQVKKTKD
jgi:hypothetical protein